VRIGVIRRMSDHPLPALRAAGVSCTTNTDDPATFNTDLAQEYTVAQQLGVSDADAYLAGLAGALCGESLRNRLTALGQQCFA
jgi:aminodeoxyfutalosine deaminase